MHQRMILFTSGRLQLNWDILLGLRAPDQSCLRVLIHFHLHLVHRLSCRIWRRRKTNIMNKWCHHKQRHQFRCLTPAFPFSQAMRILVVSCSVTYSGPIPSSNKDLVYGTLFNCTLPQFWQVGKNRLSIKYLSLLYFCSNFITAS